MRPPSGTSKPPTPRALSADKLLYAVNKCSLPDANNCSSPRIVAGPVELLGGVVLAHVVDCHSFAWVEVCEDYGLFKGECLRGLCLTEVELDRWLRRVAKRHGVCMGWETYDVCFEEEVGKAKESILRLQRAARPWLLPYADVSPDLAFEEVEVGVFSTEFGDLTCRVDGLCPSMLNVKSALA